MAIRFPSHSIPGSSPSPSASCLPSSHTLLHYLPFCPPYLAHVFNSQDRFWSHPCAMPAFQCPSLLGLVIYACLPLHLHPPVVCIRLAPPSTPPSLPYHHLLPTPPSPLCSLYLLTTRCEGGTRVGKEEHLLSQTPAPYPPQWAAGASLETSSPLFSSSCSLLPSSPAFCPHLLFPFTAPRSLWTLQYKRGSLFLSRADHRQSLVMVSCDPSFSPAPLPTSSLRNTFWALISAAQWGRHIACDSSYTCLILVPGLDTHPLVSPRPVSSRNPRTQQLYFQSTAHPQGQQAHLGSSPVKTQSPLRPVLTPCAKSTV